MTSADLRMRSLDVVPVTELAAMPITVVGGGAIGSWAAFGLAKAGAENILVYDGDTVEEHNVGPQVYGPGSVGTPKTRALYTEIERLCDVSISTIDEHVIETTELRPGLVIVAVDSMAARKLVWSKVEGRVDYPMLIEARMGAEIALLYALDPSNEKFAEAYAETLYSDEEAEELPCMARATVHCGLWIGAMICRHVTAFARKEVLPFECVNDLKNLLSFVNESP